MIKVLVGMIASGKSTYAADRAERYGDLVINDDALVTAVHGNYRLYEKKHKALYKGLENEILHYAVASGHGVVVDRGLCMGPGARARYIAMAKSLDQPIEAVLFPREDPDTHAMRRQKSGPRGYTLHYWLQVANRHAALYARPTKAEGFDIVTELKDKDIENLLCPK